MAEGTRDNAHGDIMPYRYVAQADYTVGELPEIPVYFLCVRTPRLEIYVPIISAIVVCSC